jgi:hypothetical protein
VVHRSLLTVLSDQLPGVMDKRDGLVVELCQGLQVLVFALVGERVDCLVAVVEVGKKRVRPWKPCQLPVVVVTPLLSPTHPSCTP